MTITGTTKTITEYNSNVANCNIRSTVANYTNSKAKASDNFFFKIRKILSHS